MKDALIFYNGGSFRFNRDSSSLQQNLTSPRSAGSDPTAECCVSRNTSAPQFFKFVFMEISAGVSLRRERSGFPS